MKVGYLRTAGASFAPDSINVFHNIDPTSDRYIEQQPFVSTSIQGVAGTNPVNFELASVKADTPAAARLFKSNSTGDQRTLSSHLEGL